MSDRFNFRTPIYGAEGVFILQDVAEKYLYVTEEEAHESKSKKI